MTHPEITMKNNYVILIFLSIGILAIFLGRALLSVHYNLPHTFQLFDILTITGSLYVIFKNHFDIRREDWLIALLVGFIIGLGMLFASHFSPYPFLGIVDNHLGQAFLRGAFTTIATLGGLVIMRRGGPVQLHIANGDWQSVIRGVRLGLVVALPLAVMNVFALQFTQGQAIQWQNPLTAMLDALQPGIVEEVIYRFALWGLLWLMLRNSFPARAVWVAGLLAMLVHNYSHFDDLFLQSPFVALGMGVVMALLWGLPPLFLARYRGLESAISFHWLQDVARFLAGY